MITSTKETITPAIAQKFLSTSVGNRPLSKDTIEMYAREMKAGNWIYNGVPIIFDQNNNLLDGHHRCHAVIRAGVAIESQVTKGVPHEAFSTIDNGRNRTLGQLIGIDGTKHYNAVAASVNFVYRLMSGLNMSSNAGGAKSMRKTNKAMLDFYYKDKPNFDKAGRFATDIFNKAHLLQKSIIGGLFYYLTFVLKHDEGMVTDFFTMLCSYDTADNKTINTLRKRLIANCTNITKLPPLVVNALVIKAWNSFVTDTPLKCVKYTPETEEFPKIL